jgi:hypothetical protein
MTASGRLDLQSRIRFAAQIALSRYPLEACRAAFPASAAFCTHVQQFGERLGGRIIGVLLRALFPP